MNPPETSRRLAYQPALDGIRAVALVAVVAYHAGIDWMGGGFLGVSSFFTLSGFLITSLLLVEREETGRVALRNFWTRRLARLFPAALVTITATVLVAAVLADDSQLSRLRADALASLFHFSNWRFVAESDSYAALFQSPSVFRHFWSLAVEEQYYVVFPLVIVGGLHVFRGLTRRFIGAMGLLTAVTLAWPAVQLARGATSDRLYFGTDTRLGELIIGSLLALWWVRRGRNAPEAPRIVTAVGLAAASGLGWMWATAHPDDEFLYRGGLALHSALTLVVILAATAPRGPIRAILATEPLRRLGVVSYGAYLIHWPVLLWLQQKTSLGAGGRFAIGLSVTVPLAFLSYRFVERPIRRLPVPEERRRVWVAIPASVTVAATIIAVTAWRTPTTEVVDFAAAESTFEELGANEVIEPAVGAISETASRAGPIADSQSAVVTPPVAAAEPADESDRPVRLTGFGDSTALMTGLGVLRWAEDHPDEVTMVQGHAKLGCGLVTGATRRVEGREGEVGDDCDTLLEDWTAAIRGKDVDIAFVQLGAWEAFDHQLEPGQPFVAIGRDEEFDDLLRQQLNAAVDALREHTDLVAIIASPDVGEARFDSVTATDGLPELDPARSARWRELVREVAAAHEEVVVIDLAGWIDARADDRRLRPDGVHFSEQTAREVADWLVPEMLAEYEAMLANESASAVDMLEPGRADLVLVVGDSVAADAFPAIEAALTAALEPVDARFELFPALPRNDDEAATWRWVIESADPDVLIVSVGFWETAASGLLKPPVCEPGFEDVYRRTVVAPWFDHLSENYVRTIFLGMAPVRETEWNELIRVTVAVADAEAADHDGVDFVPLELALAPDGYADVLPDPRSGISERVRRIDGLHLCPDGAERVVDLLLPHLYRLIGLTVSSDEWRGGSWRRESWDPELDLATECPAGNER